MSDWALIVVAPGLTTYNERLWLRMEHILAPGCGVEFIVVDSAGSDALQQRLRCLPNTIYIRLVRPGADFSYPAAANAAAFSTDARFLCFLHDDALPQKGTVWLDALRGALEQPRHGMAVPLVRGPNVGKSQRCANVAPVTKYGDTEQLDQPWYHRLWWYHTSEYVNNACIAITADRFKGIGGFAPELDGYDWWGQDLQKRVVGAGQLVAVAPAAKVVHQGAATYGRQPNKDELYHRNLERYCGRHGLWSEYGGRPNEARITPPCKALVCVLTDGSDLTADKRKHLARSAKIAREVRSLISGSDTMMPLMSVVVDESGDGNVLDSLAAGEMDFIYSPRLTDHPEWEAADLAGAERLFYIDARKKRLLHCDVGPRLRCGTHYAIPPHIEEFHVGLLGGSGIGDAIMMTPAFRAFKRKYPHIRLVCHHGWEAGRVWENNPDVAEVIIESEPSNPAIVDWSSGHAVEGTVQAAIASFGLQPGDVDEREFVYVVTDEERAYAETWIWGHAAIGVGWNDALFFGVQLHGNWEHKQWAHTADLVTQMLSDGAAVVTAGSDSTRYPALPEHPRLLRMDNTLSLRQAIAVISLLDGWVGFDSGVTYAAAALGVPLVALYASHDPRGLIADASTGSMVAIRHRTPAQCQRKHGKSCRSNGEMGNQCPLREGFGADCLDDVSAARVYKELKVIARKR